MSRHDTVARIAFTRQRRKLRHRRKHSQLFFALVLGVSMGVVLVVGRLPLPLYESFWTQPGAYHYGETLSTDPAATIAVAREVGAVAFLAAAVLSALSTALTDAWEEPPAELATAVPTRVAVAGVAIDELLENGWFFLPLSAAGVVAFVAGAADPLAGAGLVVGTAALLATGLLVGTSCGLGVRAAFRASPRLYAARFAIGPLVVFGVYLALFGSRLVGGALAASPLGWYGDLLLSTAAAGNSTHALAALAASATVLGAATISLPRLVEAFWFADPAVDRDDGADSASGSATRADATLDRLCTPPTAAVVRATWRRMRRSPRALFYVLLPAGIVLPVSAELATARPGLLPAIVATYVGAAAGMGTALNPLGNEVRSAATIGTTPGGLRATVRGHAMAALLPGWPIAAALAGGAALAIGLPVSVAIVLALAGAVVATIGVGIALGVGAFLPNLEGTNPGTLAAPTIHATGLYLFAMGLVATPLLGGTYAATTGGTAITAPLPALAGLVGTAAIGGLLALSGYRYAARAIGDLAE